MPLDPSIPLQFRPADPAGDLMKLRTLALQNQLGNEQLSAARMENQQRAMSLEDEQVLRQAYGQAGGDLQKLSQMVAGKVSPKAMMALNQAVLKQREQIASISKNELEVHKAHAEAIAGAAQQLLQLPDEQSRAAAYPQAITALVQQGHLKPEDVPTEYPGQQAMQSMIGPVLGAKNLIDQDLKRREAVAAEKKAGAAETQANTSKRVADARIPGIQADTEAKQRENAATLLAGAQDQADYETKRGGLPFSIARAFPDQFDAEAVRRAGMTLAQQSTAQHQKVEEQQGAQRIAQGARRVAIETANSARMQRQFDATYGAMMGPDGKPLEPEAAKRIAEQDPMATAIANYKLPPPSASRSGPASAILRKVMYINPGYNAQNWQAQGKMMAAYTSGSISKEISGINTALGHVGTLGDAIDALHNGDVVALNRIGNALGVQTGATPVTTFRAIVHKVAPELNRAYVGGVGAQGEIQAQESDFDPALGDRQLRSNVAITAKLLRSKIGSLENQWNQTLGGGFESRFIMPEAKAAIEKWSPRGAATTKPGKPPLTSFEK